MPTITNPNQGYQYPIPAIGEIFHDNSGRVYRRTPAGLIRTDNTQGLINQGITNFGQEYNIGDVYSALALANGNNNQAVFQNDDPNGNWFTPYNSAGSNVNVPYNAETAGINAAAIAAHNNGSDLAHTGGFGINPATGQIEQGYSQGSGGTSTGPGGAGSGTGPGGNTGGAAGGLTPPPANSAYKDSDAYKSLPQDLKDLVDLGYSSFIGTPEQQKNFTDALTNAQALADPYAHSQLLLATAEFQLAIAKSNNDYKAQVDILNRTRQSIADDLKLNADHLTLEQQAEMARATTAYNEDMLTIADAAAEKGLTFGTGARSRSMAEDIRTTQQQDIVQSSNRSYNFQMDDLKARAARGDTEAQAQLDNLSKNNEFNMSSIGQAAERVLGSGGAAGLNLPGFTPQGGALGSIEQDRRTAILNAARLGLGG